MKCDVCNKELTFLYFIGKSNVCNKCIAKHTVFKEMKQSEESMFRLAIRCFDINSFDDLKKLTNADIDRIAMGQVKQKRKKTLKYKKNKASAVKVDGGDMLDYQSEFDLEA